MQPTIGRQMIGVGVGSGVGVGAGVGIGVGAGVGGGVGAGVGSGVGVGGAVGVGVGVRVGVGAGADVAVGRGVAAGAEVGAGVGAGVGSTVEIGPPGDPEPAGSSSTLGVPEPAAPVLSEPVAPVEIGPGCVPLAPALAPGPGVEPAAGAAETPGIALPADGSGDGTAAAPSITIFAGSGPPNPGNAGERIPVPMTTAMITAGITATATTVTERFSTIGPYPRFARPPSPVQNARITKRDRSVSFACLS